MKIFTFFALLIRDSPFYPYFYYFKFCWKDNEKLLEFVNGKTLEVGCGSNQFKDFIVNSKPDIDYITSDYMPDEGHYEFKEQANLKKYFFDLNFLKDIFIGPSVNYKQIDLNLDCTNLKEINSETYDTYISLEVTEHIYDYKNQLLEAYRILKKNGNIIISMPFLYQEHGPIDKNNNRYKLDYNRFTRSKIVYELENLGFEEVNIFTNCGFYIGLTQLINSNILNNYYDLSLFFKILFFPIMPLFFFMINIFCRFMDLITKKNDNYYPRLNFVFKKI